MPIGDADILKQLFAALDRELSRNNDFAHLVVVGGSALVAQGFVDRATDDVDVVALVVDEELHSAEILPPALRSAVARVAINFQLSDDRWLNGGPASLAREGSGLPEGMATRLVPYYVGDHLTVELASRKDLIYFKFFALADRSAPRDTTDLQALKPTSDELRAAARWARAHYMPGPFDEQIARALAAFDVDDEGRVDE